MGIRLKELNESFPMNAIMTVEMVLKKLCVHLLWLKIASALEGLELTFSVNPYAADGYLCQYKMMQKKLEND